MDIVDLKQPDLYINRELSHLEFNRRVLLQAEDESIPLLERLRYLYISSTIMDEFFEIRVAGLKQMAKAGSSQTGLDNLVPVDVLKAVQARVRELVDITAGAGWAEHKDDSPLRLDQSAGNLVA